MQVLATHIDDVLNRSTDMSDVSATTITIASAVGAIIFGVLTTRTSSRSTPGKGTRWYVGVVGGDGSGG